MRAWYRAPMKILRLLCWTLWLWPALACAAPTPEGVREQMQRDYAELETIASEPLDAVRFFRVRYWQPLSEHALVLWLGREEPYLIDLRDRCFGIERELWLRLADFERPGRNQLRARWSRILLRDGRDCRIGRIRALDYDALLKLDARFHPPITPAPPPPPAPHLIPVPKEQE